MKLTVDPDAPLCSSGKRPFRTEEEARRRLIGAQHLRRVGDSPRLPGCVEEGVYRCGACSWFHLTSSTKPRRRGELGNRGRRRR